MTGHKDAFHVSEKAKRKALSIFNMYEHYKDIASREVKEISYIAGVSYDGISVSPTNRLSDPTWNIVLQDMRNHELEIERRNALLMIQTIDDAIEKAVSNNNRHSISKDIETTLRQSLIYGGIKYSDMVINTRTFIKYKKMAIFYLLEAVGDLEK